MTPNLSCRSPEISKSLLQMAVSPMLWAKHKPDRFVKSMVFYYLSMHADDIVILDSTVIMDIMDGLWIRFVAQV